MKNRELTMDETGQLVETGGWDKTIKTLIVRSIAILKDSWWAAPGFGLESPGRKVAGDIERRVENRVQAALKWLKDSGRAKSITVAASRGTSPGRVNIRILAVQSDEKKVEYSTFVQVN